VKMRRLIATTAVAALLVLAATPALAATTIPANDPSSGKLVEQPKVYNGKRVTFSGEAIGEVMVRGDYAWIHLNDDAYMERNVEEGAPLKGYNSGMAVWVPAALTKQIDTWGDYKHEGSIVQIEGTFNAACKEHGGDMDIHADKLTLIREGHPALDPVRPWKAGLAALLIAAAAGLYLLERSTRNRMRASRGV
jgi:hypothetical protein